MNSDSVYDLNLPLVREGEEPLPLDSPTEEAQFAHARFLASGKSAEFWEERRARMNPKPFRFDPLNLPVFDVPQMDPPME